MTRATIGICEDDDELRGVLRDALEREGHRVRATASGTEAVSSFAGRHPDLLVLDIGLPDADGRDVCQALRARGMTAPVVFLTARDALNDRLSGFKVGGDDYLIKPLALPELIVRVDAVLRRAAAAPPSAPPTGLTLDPAQHAVAGPTGPVPLTPTEFRILAALASDRGSVIRRATLVAAAWPAGAIVSDNTLDAYVSRLRGKLRDAGLDARIHNARGVGYALRCSRLLIASLATLAAGLGVLLLLGNALFAGTISGQTQRLLASRTDAQIAALTVRPAGVSIRQTHNDGTLDGTAWIFDRSRLLEGPGDVPPKVSQTAVSLGSSVARAQIRSAGHYRIKVAPLYAGTPAHRVGAVVVEINTTPFNALRHNVLVGSLAIGAILLLGVAIAVDRVLRGALDPVRAMTQAAAGWSEHDLERRFALGGARDEIGGLASTLDQLLERIAASRRHERRFAEDAAHELRTPLAAIQGRVELALDPRARSEAQRAALTSVSAQATRMTATVDALLALARAETDPEQGRIDLATIARGFDGVEVTTGPGVLSAEGEAEIVRGALAPLVENAQRYARSRVVIEVTTSGGRSRATVRDDGPGLDADLGEAAFEPGRRGAEAPEGGAGLGLPLARRLARACGGEVTAQGGPGGCFTLDLPAVAERR